MIPVQLGLQTFQVVQPVTLRGTDPAVAGHVLHLPQVMAFQPVRDDALAELAGALNFRVDFLYKAKQMVQAVFQITAAIHAGKQTIGFLLPCFL